MDPTHQPLTMLSPAQMAEAAEDAAYAKATGKPLKSFLLGLTAGGYIALGFVFYVTSQVGAADMPWGAAKVLGGLVFATGLVLVVLTGAELFTSSTLTLTARASGRITWAPDAHQLGRRLHRQLPRALTMVALVYLGGTWHKADGGWGAVVLETALTKVHHTFLAGVRAGHPVQPAGVPGASGPPTRAAPPPTRSWPSPCPSRSSWPRASSTAWPTCSCARLAL